MTQTAANNQTILVIEDDHATLEFMKLFLDMAGYQVQTAVSGTQGLVSASSQSIQAILLDRRLPDMDGVRVCAQLRARLGPDLPIIMLTADSEPALEANARAAGVTSLLRKPFLPDTLLQRLAAVLPA